MALLTTAQAAAQLGVSTRTIYRYIEAGKITPHILPSGHLRYSLDALGLADESEDDSE